MYDVIIVGGGPTGATAAKTLSSKGYSVLLAERFKLPRYKSCSGILIKKTVDLIKLYFSESVSNSTICTPKKNKGMIFTNDKGIEYRFEQEGLNIWRFSFDYWLISKAKESGCQIADGVNVSSCEEYKDFVNVKLCGKTVYEEKAKYVINCEGSSGLIKIKLTNRREETVKTFQTFNKGSIELDYNYFYAYLQPELSEYDAWFNVKDNMLVLGVAVKDKNKIGFFYSRFLDYMKTNHKLQIDKEIKAEKWLMPSIKRECNIYYGAGRVLFAGETAGFLNPMGEGISSGIESGFYAADAIINNFNNPDTVLTDYKNKTDNLKNYMKRQWSFVGNIADTFSKMKV